MATASTRTEQISDFYYNYGPEMKKIKKGITSLKRRIKVLQKPCKKKTFTRVNVFAKNLRCSQARHQKPYTEYKKKSDRLEKQYKDIQRFTQARINYLNMMLGGFYASERLGKSVHKQQKELLKLAKKYNINPYKNGRLKSATVLKSQITRAKKK
jgi:hypothetical protein